jgi:hypothetical protein
MAAIQACADLEGRQLAYVLAVATTCPVAVGTGTRRAGAIAARLPRSAWQRCIAGPGAKGHRYYDWAWVAIGLARPGHRWIGCRSRTRLALFQASTVVVEAGSPADPNCVRICGGSAMVVT